MTQDSTSRQVIARLESDLFGNTKMLVPETTGDFIAELERIAEKISKPTPSEIWFIDRTSEYYRFLSMCKPDTDAHSQEFYTLPFGGLPLRCWGLDALQQYIAELRTEKIERFKMSEQDADDSLLRSFPVRESGVWVVWNTGDVQRIVLGDENDQV